MKTTLLKIAAAAAGITLVLCLALGGLIWYKARPRPWNTTAVTASEIPTFGADTGKDAKIHLRYPAQNHTDTDYKVEKVNDLRIMARLKNGALTSPLEGDYISIDGPLFIPAQQSGTISLVVLSVTPAAQASEQTNEDYHEQIRDALNQSMNAFQGFAIFDEKNRYQIDLPKWAVTKPAKPGKP
jgi:hypothetical protein